jgi:hypothetical protein
MSRAGSARIDITPPVGLELSGWAFGPSVGIHDRLLAKALYLQADDGEVFLLVTADLIGLDTSTADEIRGALAQRLKISRDHIMLGCSHTHSGPGTMTIRRWGAVDQAYLRTVVERLVSVGAEAERAATEGAAVGAGAVAAPDISVNRRRDEGGVVDDELGVLRVDSGMENMVVWNFSCHPVAAHNYKNLISADYPGYASRYLERALGKESTALFTLGAAGNINPVVFHHIRYARRYGNKLGRLAYRAWSSAQTSDELAISCSTRRVRLPVQKLPDEETLANEISKWRGESEQLVGSGASRERIDSALIKLEWAEEASAIQRAGNAVEYLDMELQAVRLNDAVLLALPAELFVQIGLNIKAASPFARTVIVELANGNLCYLPTSEAYVRGGYETEFSAKVYGVYFLDERSQPAVETAAGGLLAELAGE